MSFKKDNMKSATVFKLVLSSIFVFFIEIPLQAQSRDAQAIANADTLFFQSMKSNGWQLYNSYGRKDSAGQVSVLFIIRHARSGINWSEFQAVGIIKLQEVLPAESKTIDVMLLTDHYQVKIDPNGAVFLKLFSGQLPLGDPTILPLEFSYSIR